MLKLVGDEKQDITSKYFPTHFFLSTKGNIVISQWKNQTDITVTQVTRVYIVTTGTHQLHVNCCMYDPMHWEHSIASVLVLLQMHNLSLNIRGYQTNTNGGMFYKVTSLICHKHQSHERQTVRNYSRWKKTKTTWQLNAICDTGLNWVLDPKTVLLLLWMPLLRNGWFWFFFQFITFVKKPQNVNLIENTLSICTPYNENEVVKTLQAHLATS